MPQTLPTPPPAEKLPAHIGIIMDGNGRWARLRGFPRELGHREGAKTFTRIMYYCRDIGIRVMTVYAFSTENWKRPKHEVDALMTLLGEYLRDTVNHKKDNIRLRVIGDRAALSDEFNRLIDDAERESLGYTGLTVNLAINYGGREELLHAARALAADCAAGTLRPEEIGEAELSARLYTAGQPDPDLIIRPSGEERLSNFLLWQSAYSELVFMDVLWPDFTPENLNYALAQYAERERRFGGI